MKKYLISPYKKQYKANLHCHSTLSDGCRTPEELKTMYKANGYSILSITDHEAPKSHTYLDDEEFLTITGYEVYVRKSPECIGDDYEPEVHLNLFAREPENETIICYNSKYCKRISEERKAELKKAGSQRTREYSTEYVNELIQTAIENGYLVAYNHPYWSLESEAQILAYDGYFSLEMCNYSSHRTTRLEYCAALYDRMLIEGKKVFCHAGDDNHNGFPDEHPLTDSYGSFTMIMPEEFTYDSVFKAMETGEMYSSMGPVFREISIEGDSLHVECSEVEQITVYFGSKSPRVARVHPGQVLTEADFKIDPRAKYVRVSIFDKAGKSADTRGFFREELGL